MQTYCFFSTGLVLSRASHIFTYTFFLLILQSTISHHIVTAVVFLFS